MENKKESAKFREDESDWTWGEFIFTYIVTNIIYLLALWGVWYWQGTYDPSEGLFHLSWDYKSVAMGFVAIGATYIYIFLIFDMIGKAINKKNKDKWPY